MVVWVGIANFIRDGRGVVARYTILVVIIGSLGLFFSLYLLHRYCIATLNSD